MNLDQQTTVIEVVLGERIPLSVAVLKAYNWQSVAATWIKFAFSGVGSLVVA